MSTRIVKGYRNGQSFDVVVVEIRGIVLEASTALRLDLMCEAAARDGIELVPREGFRENATQRAIWLSRQCTCGRNKKPHARDCVITVKGPAARPGYSAHEAGEAIDFKVRMTCADLREGRKSREYEWLEAHAHEFGFARTVDVEPWHWQNVAIQEYRDG